MCDVCFTAQVPELIPELSEEQLLEWSECPYPELVSHILSLFLDDEEIPAQELHDVVSRCFIKFKDALAVIETKELGRVNGSAIHVAELFHGPTLAFKDLAMQVVGGLHEYFLKRRNRTLSILVGTSGAATSVSSTSAGTPFDC